MAHGARRVGRAAPAAVALRPGRSRRPARHAWLAEGQRGRAHPAEGLTLPDADKPGAYTWNKAPRLGGEVVETGALARRWWPASPCCAPLWRAAGHGAHPGAGARCWSWRSVLPWMEEQLLALRDGAPWCASAPLPREGQGVGLCEAARGSAGPLAGRSAAGRIANYQIIAPTSWNFSPRDAAGTPGALEAALVGAPVRPGEATPVAVQHIVRSFDPCMVCTVH
jgi:Ni,Fe-hydrogenase I large subunit